MQIELVEGGLNAFIHLITSYYLYFSVLISDKSRTFQEVEEDREKLRKMNQQLDRTMRDQKQRTINYKGLLEQEIMELRAKLKNAEEKNVELINDNVARSPILSYDKIDDDEIPSRGYMERISRADTPTTSKCKNF